ncbi:F-box protein SKIP28 [Vitis vinifera]|uniref:F-box protein SKIP28 n=1 Tax=Vitis vinifera TaxID=29760 RepID=A0A438EL70_VITVI|nr:F-box protein SKIP28 [Vitis vinifera]
MKNSHIVENKEHEAVNGSMLRGQFCLHLVIRKRSLLSRRSMRDAVDKDVLLWLDIIVEKPLNMLFSDEIMIKLTSKANGRLRTLALMSCIKITDDGLQQLYLPACTGLTPEGIMRAVKTLTEIIKL